MNEKMGISQKRGIFSNPKILPWLFLAPAVGLILVFYGYPIIRTIAISLRDYNVLNPSDSTFVGGKNFSRMLKDGVLKISLKNTVIYVVASLSLQFVLGFALALCDDQRRPGECHPDGCQLSVPVGLYKA